MFIHARDKHNNKLQSRFASDIYIPSPMLKRESKFNL